MKETAVAEKYSRALFLALEGKKSVSLDETGKQLAQISGFLNSNENLRSALQSPLVPLQQKRALMRKNIESLFKKDSSLLHNFLEILITKKRLDLLPLIIARFGKIVQESMNTVRAYVKSANQLDEKKKKEIEEKLSGLFKKNVMIEMSVHPELIAGIVVQAGDVVIDNSLKAQLKKLRIRFRE